MINQPSSSAPGQLLGVTLTDLKSWAKPTFSPEHGVLLVLLGSLLTGAAQAQAWIR